MVGSSFGHIRPALAKVGAPGNQRSREGEKRMAMIGSRLPEAGRLGGLGLCLCAYGSSFPGTPGIVIFQGKPPVKEPVAYAMVLVGMSVVL